QDEAVIAISKALRRSRADLKDPRRPIGSFIFLGATGVGKTFLARSWISRSVQRLEVSHNGSGILGVIFLRECRHLALYPALDHESHVRTTNLELQKARGFLAPICIPTMALSTALQEKPSSLGSQVFGGEWLVSMFCLPTAVIPIDSASGKCRYQDECRRDDGCHCTLDFERGHHGTPPPLRSISPPKYPAAAMNPEATNIKIKYRHSPVRDIASLTTSLQTAKPTRRPHACQPNRGCQPRSPRPHKSPLVRAIRETTAPKEARA